MQATQRMKEEQREAFFSALAEREARGWSERRLFAWACWSGVKRGTIEGFRDVMRSRLKWVLLGILAGLQIARLIVEATR